MLKPALVCVWPLVIRIVIEGSNPIAKAASAIRLRKPLVAADCHRFSERNGLRFMRKISVRYFSLYSRNVLFLLILKICIFTFEMNKEALMLVFFWQ